MNVLVCPGAIVCDEGTTESTAPKSCVVNCQLTVPGLFRVPSRRKMIAVHLPPTGWATSDSPWLPSPCGLLVVAKLPFGSIRVNWTREVPPVHEMNETSLSAPEGTLNVTVR